MKDNFKHIRIRFFCGLLNCIINNSNDLVESNDRLYDIRQIYNKFQTVDKGCSLVDIKKEDLEYVANKITNRKIVVGYSGGPDSLVIILLLQSIFRDLIEIFPVIVNHKLKKTADQEAQWAIEILKQHTTISAKCINWDHIDIGNNIHKQARDARYRIMTEYCKEIGSENIFVAHHLDDNAETVIMRIIRGCGIEGICGMYHTVKIHNNSLDNRINLMRPMLDIRKDEILGYLEDLKIDNYINDPLNRDNKFARVKIRNLLSELKTNRGINENIEEELIDNNKHFDYETIISRLNLLSHNAKRNNQFIKKYISHKFNRFVFKSKYGYHLINISLLILEDDEIIFRILRDILCDISPNEYPPKLNSLFSLWEKMRNTYLSSLPLKLTLNKCTIEFINTIDNDPELNSLEWWNGNNNMIAIIIYREPKFIDQSRYFLPFERIIWNKNIEIQMSILNIKDKNEISENSVFINDFLRDFSIGSTEHSLGLINVKRPNKRLDAVNIICEDVSIAKDPRHNAKNKSKNNIPYKFQKILPALLCNESIIYRFTLEDIDLLISDLDKNISVTIRFSFVRKSNSQYIL